MFVCKCTQTKYWTLPKVKNLLFFIIIPYKTGLSSISNGEKNIKMLPNWAQRKKLRGKNKSFIFAVKKFHNYET